MEVQLVGFPESMYCTVFEVSDGAPEIVAKKQGTQAEIGAWLVERNFPTRGSLVLVREGLAPGYYIKPAIIERFFRVDADNHPAEVDVEFLRDVAVAEHIA